MKSIHKLLIKYKFQFLFVVVFTIINCVAYYDFPGEITSIRAGILAVLIVLAAQALVPPYQGPNAKGVEGLWRMAQRIIIIYTIGLVFILFQKTDNAREMMKVLDSSLGKRFTREWHTYE